MAAKEKKNTARAGALLLAAALVTTVLTSGTLAKYTETVDGTDTARVSLFDFTAEQVEEGTQELTKTGSTIDIFGTSADDTGVFGEDDTNGEKLVAPGMEGYVQFKFTNKSEVAVKVDFDTLGYENANRLPLIYYFNGRYYSDLYDTLNNRAYVYYFNEGDTVGITLDGGMDDLSAAVNAYAVMAATTEPGGVERRASAFLNTLGTSQNMSENLAINWFWPYEVRDGESVIRMDAPDTAMGKDGTYTVTMTPVVRFTQIDTYQTPATSNPGDQEWHPVQPDPGDEDITDPDNGPIAFKLAYYDSYNEKSAGEFTFYLKDDSHYTILYSDYFPGYSVPGFSYRFAADVGTEFTVDTADGAAVPASKTVNVELYHEGYDHAIDTKAGLLHIADDMDGTFILAADVDTGNSNGNYWNPIGWTDSDDVPFTGRINGNDKTVSGLHAVYGTGATYIGFVAINQGTIQNLNLDFAQFEGGRFVGAVTGSNAEGAVIENVHVKGDAVSGISGSGYGDFAGGIARPESWDDPSLQLRYRHRHHAAGERCYRLQLRGRHRRRQLGRRGGVLCSGRHQQRLPQRRESGTAENLLRRRLGGRQPEHYQKLLHQSAGLGGRLPACRRFCRLERRGRKHRRLLCGAQRPGVRRRTGSHQRRGEQRLGQRQLCGLRHLRNC